MAEPCSCKEVSSHPRTNGRNQTQGHSSGLMEEWMKSREAERHSDLAKSSTSRDVELSPDAPDSEPQPQTLTLGTILVIEDDARIVKVLQRLFTNEGYEIRSRSN